MAKEDGAGTPGMPGRRRRRRRRRLGPFLLLWLLFSFSFEWLMSAEISNGLLSCRARDALFHDSHQVHQHQYFVKYNFRVVLRARSGNSVRCVRGGKGEVTPPGGWQGNRTIGIETCVPGRGMRVQVPKCFETEVTHWCGAPSASPFVPSSNCDPR